MIVKCEDRHRQHAEALGLLFAEEVSEIRLVIYGFLFIFFIVGLFIYVVTKGPSFASPTAVGLTLTAILIGGSFLGMGLYIMVGR